jgi:NADPH:quinone reductase-like Zn-dependent oxidoreductase
MASTPSLPTKMKAWQYTTTKGGLIKNLKLNPEAKVPIVKDPSSQHFVQIIASCLNPVDYKACEALPSFFLPNPATPGIDYAGRIITPAKGSDLKPGQLVFGVGSTSPFAGGMLAEYGAVPVDGAAPIPQGVEIADAATVGVAGLTAHQAVVPFVKQGDRVFVNGGSGGVGVFAIQIAKTLECHVTTSCSTPNVDLCKSLGADEVIDYKKGSVLEALKSKKPFDHVLDSVGSDHELYWKAHEYTNPSAKFVDIAGEPSLSHVSHTIKAKLLPGFLGGGQRQRVSFLAATRFDELIQIGKWMAEGKVKAIIDQRFPMEQAPEAFQKLKTGRAKGKIMVDVFPEKA